MNVPFPQHDKPTGLSGASDLWDLDLGGELLCVDYFEPEPDPEPPDPEPEEGSEWYTTIRRRRR